MAVQPRPLGQSEDGARVEHACAGFVCSVPAVDHYLSAGRGRLECSALIFSPVFLPCVADDEVHREGARVVVRIGSEVSCPQCTFCGSACSPVHRRRHSRCQPAVQTQRPHCKLTNVLYLLCERDCLLLDTVFYLVKAVRCRMRR